MTAPVTCEMENCERNLIARGLCGMHYQRARKLGLEPPPTVAQRLAAGLVRQPNGCIEWTGATNRGGYGTIGVKNKSTLAHRVAWGLAHPDEPLPPVVRHFVCDNPPCCNPEHLRPGTWGDNSDDKVTKGRQYHPPVKSHCPANHAYTEANSCIDKNGGLSCRACRNNQKRALRARQKVLA